ncbi:MAG: phosphotransferase [Clostridia bacterium]|nr:phosphotransferase [Clostridia bacterium]
MKIMIAGFEQLCSKYGIVSAAPLLKGWSGDKKYILENGDGERYVLRLSDHGLCEKKKRQFELLQKIELLGLDCSRPVEFGVTADGAVYTLLSYLEGEDGETAVAALSDRAVYRLGVEAGNCLRKLHSVDIPPQELTWWDRYLEKMPRKIAALNACEYKLPMQDKILDYYKTHYEIMKNRPLVLCHGDYHLGNMIVNNGNVGIIDFDKNGIADPYDEFKPFCWNVMVSEYFETGLINGYFENSVPDDFWRILKFYTAESLISHLPWSVKFGQREIKTALEVSDNQMKWYRNFELDVPTWYKGIQIF